jgi:hypothetical protein
VIIAEEYLDRWLLYMTSQLSPRSHERYTEIVKTNLVPTAAARGWRCLTRHPGAI